MSSLQEYPVILQPKQMFQCGTGTVLLLQHTVSSCGQTPYMIVKWERKNFHTYCGIQKLWHTVSFLRECTEIKLWSLLLSNTAVLKMGKHTFYLFSHFHSSFKPVVENIWTGCQKKNVIFYFCSELKFGYLSLTYTNCSMSTVTQIVSDIVLHSYRQ